MDLLEQCLACREYLTWLGAAYVIDGPANHQRGWESVGGWLAVSPDWLVFSPHQINIQRQRLRLSILEIQSVSPTWTRLFGLIPIFPNSVAVEINGLIYRFVVDDRNTWAKTLKFLTAVRKPPSPSSTWPQRCSQRAALAHRSNLA